MALTLANTIDATDLEIEVNGAVPAAIDIGYRFRLDNEFLELRAFGRTEVTVLGGAATENIRNENAWVVERGLERTTPASHTSGASILGTLAAVAVGTTEVLPAPFAGTGDASLPIAQSDVTGLVDALAAKPRMTISATAPVAPADGDIWVQTYDDTGLTPPPGNLSYPAFAWSATLSVWLPFGSAGVDELGNLRTLVQHVADGGLNLYTYQADGTRRCSVTIDEAGIDTWWRDDDGNIISLLNCNGGIAPAIEGFVNNALGDTLSALRVDGTQAELSHAQGAHSVIVSAAGVEVTSSAAVKLNLPTADPVVAGALYSNNGVVMVSAG